MKLIFVVGSCLGLVLVFHVLTMKYVFEWITLKRRPPSLIDSQMKIRVPSATPDNYSDFWNSVDSLVGNDTLYPEAFDVDVVLDALRTAKITHVRTFSAECSYKWILGLEGGRRALFKPLIVSKSARFSNCYDYGCEHAEYEIAAFTLNRILGLRNMPYTTGRVLSWWDDILPVASSRLVKKFSLAGQSSVCSKHHCYHDDESTSFCFENGTIYGTLIYWLEQDVNIHAGDDRRYYDYKPSSVRKHVKRDLDRLPGDDTFCQVFRSREVYREDRWFADVTDISVMDFLMSHLDSTHTYINETETKTMNVMIDFGRAFCEYKKKLRIIAPITQCCKIRKRVYETLVRHQSDILDVFVAMTKNDPLHPILGQDLQALVLTRLKQLLSLVDYCVQGTSLESVLMDV